MKRGFYLFHYPFGAAFMPKRTPKYSLHKPSGQALVRINGKAIYLGQYDSAESHERYERLVADWLKGAFNVDRETLSIARLSILFIEHCRTYYRKNGRVTSEVTYIQRALKPLVAKFGRERASHFGPRKLKAVRDDMIDRDWCRTTINAAVQRINRMFRWGVENELVRAEVYQSCRAVTGLRRGRSAAKEPKPIKPVPVGDINAIKDIVSRQIWAMIQLQLVTGMRPGEVCIMRLADIRISDDVWEYRPAEHKTQHHGRDRVIFLGPKAQEILQPFLTTDRERYLFSPAAAQNERHAVQRLNRRSPMTPSQAARARKPDPVRTAGEYYERTSFTRSIARACRKAKVPVWSPNRLRHNAATELRKRFGLEGTRTVLGHTNADMTEVYAELDFAAARKIMANVG